MSAIDTIQTLLQLGVAVKGAFTNAKQADGSMDWNKFMTSQEFQNIEGDVTNLVAKLTKTDLDAAIAAIQAQEAALLGGQSVTQLPTDKLLRYSDLVHTESILVDRQVMSITPTAQALSWVVVETLLPTLVGAAKVLLPLLG
jgi:hypothetical protein